MTSHPGASQVLTLLAHRPARLGHRRLLCIDGPAGSGKTTLAEAVARAHGDAYVLHLDELLTGWDGLGEVADTLVRDVLVPMARGERGVHRRHDWARDRPGPRVTVLDTALLVVEGVGAGSRVTQPYRSLSVWMDGPAHLRRARALDRELDGAAFARHWERWAQAESALFAAERPDRTADLTITSFS